MENLLSAQIIFIFNYIRDMNPHKLIVCDVIVLQIDHAHIGYIFDA